MRGPAALDRETRNARFLARLKRRRRHPAIEADAQERRRRRRALPPFLPPEDEDDEFDDELEERGSRDVCGGLATEVADHLESDMAQWELGDLESLAEDLKPRSIGMIRDDTRAAYDLLCGLDCSTVAFGTPDGDAVLDALKLLTAVHEHFAYEPLEQLLMDVNADGCPPPLPSVQPPLTPMSGRDCEHPIVTEVPVILHPECFKIGDEWHKEVICLAPGNQPWCPLPERRLFDSGPYVGPDGRWHRDFGIL